MNLNLVCPGEVDLAGVRQEEKEESGVTPASTGAEPGRARAWLGVRPGPARTGAGPGSARTGAGLGKVKREAAPG